MNAVLMFTELNKHNIAHRFHINRIYNVHYLWTLIGVSKEVNFSKCIPKCALILFVNEEMKQ